MNEITATTYFAVMVKLTTDERFMYVRMSGEIMWDINKAAKFQHINDAKQFCDKIKNRVKHTKIVKAVTTMDIRDV